MDSFVLRRIIQSRPDGAGVHYELECGHRRHVPLAPDRPSSKSRCYECARLGAPPLSALRPVPPPPPLPAPPSAGPAPAPAKEPPPPPSAPGLDYLPAVSYPVTDSLWRAECPFLPTRPVVHGTTQEEAEEKLQRQVLQSPDLFLTGMHKRHRFFALRPPARP